MRLIFHIGVHKTGSTALQKLFYENRERLLKQGLCYPATGAFRGNHNHLAFCLFNPNKVKLTNVCHKLAERLKNEMKESGAHTAIISSEDLSVYPPENLLSHFANFDVEVIVYLRRQDDWMESMYREMVKNTGYQGNQERFWREICDGTEFSAYNAQLSVDYAALLEKWEKAVGRDKLTVRIYEPGQIAENLFEDFRQALSLDIDIETKMERANVKFPPDIIIFRQMIANALDEEARKHLQASIWWISQHYEGGHKYDFFSPAQRLEILAHFADSNEEVARRYLERENGRLFYKLPPNPDEEWQPHPGLSPQKMAQLGGLMQVYHHQRIEHHNNTIHSLNQRIERMEKHFIKKD